MFAIIAWNATQRKAELRLSVQTHQERMILSINNICHGIRIIYKTPTKYPQTLAKYPGTSAISTKVYKTPPLNTPPCLSPFSGVTLEAPCKRGQRPTVWVPKWLSEPRPHCQPEPSQTSQKSPYLVSPLRYHICLSHQINTLPVFLHLLDFDASFWTLFQYHLPIRASCLEFWTFYISLITPTEATWTF